ECLKLGIEIYYSNMDSLVINKKLLSQYVDEKKLEKLKLENVITDGYFIASDNNLK
ncbi:43980_t:CDS:1, partial [Gigaspora margarita]